MRCSGKMSSFDEFRYDFCIRIWSYKEYWIFFWSHPSNSDMFGRKCSYHRNWLNGSSKRHFRNSARLFFVHHIGQVYIALSSLNTSKYDRMTCSWRYISDPSKWRSLYIWEMASYISSTANIYAPLDKSAAEMQRNAAARLPVRHWIFV